MPENSATENSATATRQTPEPSSYERVGGAEGLRDLVDTFYRRVLDDDHLRPYFAGTDMVRLKRHQAALLTKVLGGPDGHAGRDLGIAHADPVGQALLATLAAFHDDSWTPELAEGWAAAYGVVSKVMIDAQLAQADPVAGQTAQETQQRYEEIASEARSRAHEEADRVAHQYRATAGANYSADQEQLRRQDVYLKALLQALDAVASHLNATRHVFAVEVQHLTGPPVFPQAPRDAHR